MPPDSLIVPLPVLASPQSIVAVCVSSTPLSVKPVWNAAVAASLTVWSGIVVITAGRLTTVMIAVLDTTLPAVSVTAIGTAYVPSWANVKEA